MAELDAAPGWTRERKGTPMPWSTIGRGDSCEGNLAVHWMREGGGCDGGLVEKIKRRWTCSESMSPLVRLDVVLWTAEWERGGSGI